MANNDKGKSVLIGGEESSKKSWRKVLLNDQVFEGVFDTFGSYANIWKEMIEVILQQMWNKTFNEPNMGDSGALSNPTLGTENEVVAIASKKNGERTTQKKRYYFRTNR